MSAEYVNFDGAFTGLHDAMKKYPPGRIEDR